MLKSGLIRRALGFQVLGFGVYGFQSEQKQATWRKGEAPRLYDITCLGRD